MVPQYCYYFVPAESASGQPGWKLIVPDEGMATHLHVIGLGKINKSICVGKVEGGSGWVNAVPLEGILGDHYVEFASQRILIGLLGPEWSDRHRCSNVEAALVR